MSTRAKRADRPVLVPGRVYGDLRCRGATGRQVFDDPEIAPPVGATDHPSTALIGRVRGRRCASVVRSEANNDVGRSGDRETTLAVRELKRPRRFGVDEVPMTLIHDVRVRKLLRPRPSASRNPLTRPERPRPDAPHVVVVLLDTERDGVRNPRLDDAEHPRRVVVAAETRWVDHPSRTISEASKDERRGI